jgi:hypothetical protein
MEIPDTALVLTAGVSAASACSVCSPGTYSASGQRNCSSCGPGTYANSIGSSLSCIAFLQIFQFKAPYQLSEVTVDIKSRMLTAVANVLGVNPADVVLTFVPDTLDRRSRLSGNSTGVLVNAGLTDVELSAASYVSMVTQEKLNQEMATMGLSYGQLISGTGMSPCFSTRQFIILLLSIYICYFCWL